MDKKVLGGLAAGGAVVVGLIAFLVIGRKPEPPLEPAPAPAVTEPAPAPAPEIAPPPADQPKTAAPAAKKKQAPAAAKKGSPAPATSSPAPAPAPGSAQPSAAAPKPAPKPVYSGPKEGVVLWSGELIKGGKIIIAPGIAAGGTVSNEFPGVPIDVRVDLKGVSILETPSAADGWKRVVLASQTKGRKVVSIHWSVKDAN